MRKVIKLYLDEKEILNILKCDNTVKGYTNSSNNGRGFGDIWIDYFYRADEEVKINPRRAEDMIYDYLMENNIIDKSYNKYSGRVNLSHCWGHRKEDGSVPSLWTVEYEITGSYNA